MSGVKPPAVVMERERVPVMPACQSRSVLLESEGAMLYHDRDSPICSKLIVCKYMSDRKDVSCLVSFFKSSKPMMRINIELIKRCSALITFFKVGLLG